MESDCNRVLRELLGSGWYWGVWGGVTGWYQGYWGYCWVLLGTGGYWRGTGYQRYQRYCQVIGDTRALLGTTGYWVYWGGGSIAGYQGVTQGTGRYCRLLQGTEQYWRVACSTSCTPCTPTDSRVQGTGYCSTPHSTPKYSTIPYSIPKKFWLSLYVKQ